MYYKIRQDIAYRNFEEFGYLVDLSVFRYKRLNERHPYVGDMALSAMGSVYFSVLEKTPLSIDGIVKKLRSLYKNVAESTLKGDALEFYGRLSSAGFIVSGDTYNECDRSGTRAGPVADGRPIEPPYEESPQVDLQAKPSAFLNKFFNGRPYLRSVHIEISNECNERCVHCYIPNGKKVGSIEKSLFNRIIDSCKDMRVLQLTLSGGEPFLHKEFLYFLEQCKKNDIYVNILSNLTLVNEEIIQSLKDPNVLGVQTSLYSMDKSVHEKITGVKGSFEKTKDGIMAIIENDIPLQISCPILSTNVDTYSDVKEWASFYNINVLSDFMIIGSFSQDFSNLECRLSIEDLKRVILMELGKDSDYLANIRNSSTDRESNSDSHICTVCNSSICISANGEAYPCAGWQGFIVGNLKEQSLQDIWNNSQKVNYLRNLRMKDFPKCMQCPDRYYCTMCMVRNANEDPSGNPLQVNKYYCRVAGLYHSIASSLGSAAK